MCFVKFYLRYEKYLKKIYVFFNKRKILKLEINIFS